MGRFCHDDLFPWSQTESKFLIDPANFSQAFYASLQNTTIVSQRYAWLTDTGPLCTHLIS